MLNLILFFLFSHFISFLQLSAQEKIQFHPTQIQDLSKTTNLDSSNLSKWYLSFDEINPESFSKEYLEKNSIDSNWTEIKIPSNINKSNYSIKSRNRIYLAKTLILPEAKLESSISIRLGVINDRDKVFFNGVLIGQTGEFGNKYPQAYDKIRIYDIPNHLILSGKTNLLLIEIEEYFPNDTGLTQDKVEIGQSKDLVKSLYRDEYFKLILLSMYFTVGMYFLFLYIRRKNDKENLFFATFTFLLVIYQFLRNQIKYDIGIEFIYLKKIEYLIIFTIVSFFYHFIRSYFNFTWNRITKILDSIIGILFLVGVFLNDIVIYNKMNIFLVQPIWLVYLTFILYYLFKKIKEKNLDAWIIFLGMIFIIIGTVIDSLSTRGIIVFPRIMGYVFIFFVMGLATILANRFVNLNKEIEELNSGLEKKVEQRTEELSLSLDAIKKLKLSQDGDYFLTSLLIKPLGRNRASSKDVEIEFLVKQKKKFEFKSKQHDLGGDLCRSESITLEHRPMTVFFNADAMGKSMQGAGGALVLGSVFDSILERTRLNSQTQAMYPETWLKSSFIELHKVFESFQGSMLVSIVMGVVDNETGLLYFINAEHPFSIIYRDGKASFIDEDLVFNKLGTEIADKFISVKLFQMEDGDIIINGSDGRDDILVKEDGSDPKLNYDHTLILKVIEASKAELNSIYKFLAQMGEFTDDLSILRIKYNRKNEKEKLSDQKEEIKVCVQNKNYTLAIEKSLYYISKNPNDTEVLFLLSYSYKMNKEYLEAIKVGERIRLREPIHIRNLVNLVHSYSKLGNMSRARYIASYIPEGIKEKEFVDKLIQNS
jgi:hypothetical protein